MRKYLPGLPVGVSVFLDRDGNYFFSGLRLQCFNFQKKFPAEFLGIQWLPADFFTKIINKKLCLILEKLISAFKKEKFWGIANFDILIDKTKISILECNPRLSSATPQIFADKNLTGYINPWKFYLRTFTESANPKIKAKTLPKHHYQGALLDIDVKDKIQINDILPIGWYKYSHGKIKYSGLKNKNASLNKFFLFHELSRLQTIKNCTLCTIISDFPLFTFQTGKINQKGKKLYRFFKESFLGQAYE